MIVCTNCGQHNPEDRRFCANPDCGRFLEWDDTGGPPTQPTPVGPPSDDEPQPPRHRHPDERREEPAAQRQSIQATLPEPSASVSAGEEAALTLRVRNNGTVVEELTLMVHGAMAAWTVVEPERLQLFPGAEGVATVTFRPPRQPDTPVGPLPFRVQVTSGVNTNVTATASGVVEVGGFGAATLELVPQTATGRFRTRHNVTVTNGGSLPLLGQLSARDPDETLRFRVTPNLLQVPPGGRAAAQVRARPRKRLWWGSTARRPFEVRLHPRDAQPLGADGAMMQRPLIPGWSFRLAAVAGALALAGGAFLLLQGGGGGTNGPTPSPTKVGETGTASPTQQTSPTPTPSTDNPKPTPTPSTRKTPTPTSPQQPPTRFLAEFEISENSYLDLDEGKTAEGVPDRDVWYHTPHEGERLLTPQNGARLAKVELEGGQRIDEVEDLEKLYARCDSALPAGLETTEEHIRVEEVAPTTMVVCARTDSGRVAAFRVEPFEGAPAATLRLATWELP